MAKGKRQLIYEKLMPYAQKNLKLIDVQMGEYDGGQKCHHITRQFLEEGRATSLASVLSFVPKSGVNVHFVNKLDGKFIDNTLGYLSKANIYFLIKEYTLEDLEKINMIHLLKDTKTQTLGKIYTNQQLKRLNIELRDI